jgi:serine/threonine protein kinase
MAPEQFGGRSVPASDLYGLGATLIYLVTGLHPTELSQQDLKIQFAARVTHLNSNLVDWLEWMTEPSLNKRLSSAGEAWLSLKNPRPTEKTPIAVQRQGSDIKLTKNSEFIEVIIPPQGVGFGLIAMLSGVIAANVTLYISGYNGDINPLLFLILGSFLAVAGVLKFIDALFVEVRLRIDRQQISYISHLLGWEWYYSPPAPRQDIGQLEIEQIEYTRRGTKQKLSRVSQIIIQAGNQKYQLGVKQRLSESEIEWLATELSQWLGLKLQRTLTDGKKKISR